MPFNDKGEWSPISQPQIDFLRLPTSIKEGFFGGSAGPGKTEILLMYAIVHGWHTQQGFKQLFLRRTYPEIVREILPRTRNMYLKLGARYHRQDKYWVFPREDQYGSGAYPDGGLIFFGHCEHEDDVHNYDGMEINLFTPDELTSFTEYIYTYIGFTRVRTSLPHLPAIIRSSGMPGDIGHSFVKKRFIDPAPNGGKIIVGRGGNKRIYIHSTYKDNTKLDPNYGQGLEALPDEAERRAKKYGDWSTYEGQVFDEFRDKHYPSEPDHAIHVVDPFVIPKHWPRICAIDWGYSAMCSVGWGAISPEPRVYVYRHQPFYREKIEEWAPKIKLFIDSDKPSDVVICHSANQHRGEPHTILEQVTNALGIPVRLGEKDRVAGKILIHEYLRWKTFDAPVELGTLDVELAQWILRNKGVEEYKRYCAAFAPQEAEKNLPKLRFFNTPEVKMIWDALRMCVYEKSDKSGKKKEDVAEFSGDDPYDMLRMLMHAADQFFTTAKDLQNRLNAIDQVVSQFRISGDVTAYYRNMRRVETEQLSSTRPVTRFHRARR
jgi:hypothetical protein